MGLVAAVAALPLAMASAGPVGDADRTVVPPPARDDGARLPAPSPSRLPGLGLATAARCGPQLSSGDGIEAQTCVLAQGRDTWARTYYRNTTGEELSSSLSFMGPGGRAVETQCAVGVEGDAKTCETPRQAMTSDTAGYSAVAEFARGDGSGPLLLRSGSDAAELDGQ
ncbi:hypothetical protein [Streptomyces colonosanans]|uniref:DUF3558 domain-containing protein n=1 Tax=Streptomyces colonosanans TaxID=1428652 RepID=A0A1S2PEF5_9ACTN|nr:hypothetical protein [Streptomyces colonosanans]OIJ92103.1 hypothetical protein BIV24_14675 [Streptomyces colonosanans]